MAENKIIKAENESEKKGLPYSSELYSVITYIRDTLSKELPILTIDLNYFILGVFAQKNNLLFERLDSILMSGVLDAIYTSFYQAVSTKALTAVKNGRIPSFDNLLEEIFVNAGEEAKQVGSNEITTEHVFLSILSDTNPKNKVRIVFNKAGITYGVIKNKIIESSDRFNEDDERRSKKLPKSKPNPKGGNVKIINLGIMGEDDAKGIISSIMANRGMGELSHPIENRFSFDFDLGDGIENEIPAKTTKTKRGHNFVDTYCTNLNEMAKKGKIEPLIGREKETDEIIRILGRKRKNNAILVGGEGVGKTAIGENLAFKIVEGNVPNFLRKKKIVSLDMTALIAGTTLRGMFEERVKGILDDIKANPDYILFMDNIGAVLADKKNDGYEFSSMISRSLDTGEIQVVGTSDFSSYRKTFDSDPSLARKFQKIIVEAPSVDETIQILNGLKSSYEDFHSVLYEDDAIEACAKMADRYIPERNLPDSAIDLMDEVGAYIGTTQDDEEVKSIRDDLKKLNASIDELKKEERYDEADNLSKEIKTKAQEYSKAMEEAKKKRKENPPHITKGDILNMVSIKTNIPVNSLSSDDKKKLSEMNDRLKEEIVGQDEAINIVCRALKRNRIGLRKNGCMYSAMTIGRSGCGKTLLAKKLAKELFGNENALVRFDMSEFSDKVAVNKLIGSNPGYVGYEEGGQLTEAIKNKKHCVLLLDEIEKADPEIYNVFLQVLDEGFLTDNSGMKVDFKNVIVIFTSNIGARAASDFGKGIGFNENEDTNSKKILLKELKKKFPPEFLNRLDDVIYFNSLTIDDLKKIVRLEIGKFSKSLNDLGYLLTYDDSVVDCILEQIKDEKEYGARPIMRAIQDTMEAEITDALLSNEYESGHTFEFMGADSKISLK